MRLCGATAAYYISRTELMLLAHRYPHTAKKIRRFAIKLALSREVVATGTHSAHIPHCTLCIVRH